MSIYRHITPALVPILSVFWPLAGALAAAAEGNLRTLDTTFEPLHEGKNVLHIEVQNTAPTDQTFAVHVQTKSPSAGWGRPYFATIKGNQKERIRVPHKIHDPLTDAAWIRLRYYNPPSVERYEFDNWFKQARHLAGDLPREPRPATSRPAEPPAERAVVEVFRQLQEHLRERAYARAWTLFTADLKQVEFCEDCRTKDAFQTFVETMDLPSRSWWSRMELLAMQPNPVTRTDEGAILTAMHKNRPLAIHLVEVDGRWRIDWIGGFTLSADWKDRLLPMMQKRRTEHFDIYVLHGSTAEKEIERIIEEREKAFRRVCEFAGKNEDVRICLILFEDGQSKQRVTWHQGDGWAFDRTIVEVYSPQRKLDPAHETTHILMETLGHPPALFNEGFAVCMQAGQIWDGEPVDKTAARLAQQGRLAPLGELSTRTEIGARKDDGQVAYPESASFVKFLIDRYGKERFVQAYGTLKNSNKASVHEENRKTLERIYGKPLRALENEWRSSLPRAAG